MVHSSSTLSCCICLDVCSAPTFLQKVLGAVCRRTGSDHEAWSSLSCRHVCCHQCLRRWIDQLAATRRHDLLVCPVPQCTQPIHATHVASLGLAPAALSFVIQTTRLRLGRGLRCAVCHYINPHKEPGQVRQKHCLQCRAGLCGACGRPWHKRMTCAQADALQRRQHLTPDDLLFVHLATVQWKCQPCPHCGVITERRSGCASMTCRFCWKRWVWTRV
ncbi:Aste57867_19829 [Aphanomyces stellatus]|uniref:Aste57867_19829 protein n=1 Tax=Aphanomyces stellatus TaxID=120398 RepID=A0A485LE71_9STRA|nr:hypothetical protein As57867_019764 [Aphanomyces stellatus]VFT96527.1 Aste57867_19829 [Aphanomyces stellatus]